METLSCVTSMDVALLEDNLFRSVHRSRAEAGTDFTFRSSHSEHLRGLFSICDAILHTQEESSATRYLRFGWQL